MRQVLAVDALPRRAQLPVDLWITGLAQRPPTRLAATSQLSTAGGLYRRLCVRRSLRGPLAAPIRAGLQQVLMIPHSIAVPSDVDDVAVMDQPVDEGGGHHFVAEHAAPVL